MTGRLTPEIVWNAARAGDSAALQAVDYEAGNVSRALASIIAVLDPELVVIGGGLGEHGEDVLLGAVRDHLESMTPLGPPPIEVSTLSRDAVVLGALAIGLATAREIVFNHAVAEPVVS
jgi:predicted NBD/HSP70 family sugar kinase